MKRFVASTLAAIMLLTVFASAAIAADDNNTTVTSSTSVANVVEVRGPVYNGTNLTDILTNSAYGDGTTVSMNADQFAAFFYDIDNNVTTESLAIKNVAGTSGRIIGEHGLVYTTTIGKTNYKYKDGGWGNYNVLGFFADKYIPLKSGQADKLAKLILDSKDKYTLKTGEKLDLGKGYSLTAKQVDVDGKKVWLEFDKDGQYVDDQIVATDSGDHTWTCQLDKIQGEDDVDVLKVHVDQVFQGAVDSIAQIEGLWLIDYANAIKINSDDEFGKLNDVAINGATITINNDDTFTLTRNSDQEIGQGMYFKVADSDALRFYAYKQYKDGGTYDVRGTVATGAANWTADSFAGFFYDLDKNVKSEKLIVSSVSGRVIPEDGLQYSTTIQNVGYKYKDTNWTTYPVIGFFAQKYVPLKSGEADKLAKLILDSKDKYTLKTGEKLDLGSGYSLTAKQVDVDGKKVWLEFDKDGQYVDDQIVATDSGDHTWTCQLDKVQGEDDVDVLKVHVDQVFQGAVDSIAQIEGLWLIDYANAIKINSDDEFGKLNDVAINGATITIKNKDTFTLTRNSDQEIGQGMYFKIADSSDLRYYPYIEQSIGNGTNLTTETGLTTSAVANNTSVVVPTNATNVTAPSGGETSAVNGTETTTPITEETTTSAAPVANNTTGKSKTPAFTAGPAILGLLAVAYLVRKQR
jgi:S-layer protein (TIGR01567 family)